VLFKKPFSKLPCVCLPFENLANKKHFPIKEKFGLVFKKVFSFYFGRKILYRSCEKFRNILLFVYYIKFDPQSFDCYIICFESFFFSSISSFRISFNLTFISTLILILLIIICFSLILFLIEIFYLSNLVSIFFIAIYLFF